jgi:uncharacterized protein
MTPMSEKRPSSTSTALHFNVAQLLKQTTGARRSYDIDADLSELDDKIVIVAPLRGRVRCMRIGTGILVTGALWTTVRMECTRCLTEFDAPVQMEIEEEFRPTIDVQTGATLAREPDQDEATLIDGHHTLDLTEIVRQDMWLSLQVSPLCRSDCKGLCPQCGQNRNQSACDCLVDPVDARWMALLDGNLARGE